MKQTSPLKQPKKLLLLLSIFTVVLQNSYTGAFTLPNRNSEIPSAFKATTTTKLPNNYDYEPNINNNKEKTNELLLFASIAPGGDGGEDSSSSDKVTSWNEKITKIANIASILCAIDCTVLPLFSVALSFLGVFKTSTVSAGCCGGNDLIGHIGHLFANYFVLPVAGTVAIMHFATKKFIPSVLTTLGMSFVYVTNSHGGPILKLLPHELNHILHHNPVWHRVVNLSGVALMLGANYLSKRMGCADDKCCDHDHGQDL